MKSFVLFSLINLWGVGDTSDAHLMVLVSQSAQQLSELQQLLETANITSEQLKKSVELSEKLQKGMDKALEPFRASRRFQKLIEKIKKTRSLRHARYRLEESKDLTNEFKNMFPEEAKELEEDKKLQNQLQDYFRKSNDQDLDDIHQMQDRFNRAAPGERDVLSQQATLKSVESQIVMRRQLQQLTEQMSVLVSQIEAERKQKEIEKQTWRSRILLEGEEK